ncbi:C3HC zinc finger-like-domain-containing protein [Scheffersomyces amazonensis]|uniref:C3HC zinc finger-like-domain-containing protein n=1 Tax=Scheffersomyces amazonensis TaxID=1078765 RepID=UPI00315DA4D8
MDGIFKMSIDDITSSTPKLLRDYLDVFQNTSFNSSINSNINLTSTSPNTIDKATFNNHPEIQYFQQVKSKNHYNYHKSKISKQNQSIDNIHAKMTVFDPYNSDFLLQRLKTFSVMNWRIPELYHRPFEDRINELKCARNGWKCVSFSLNNNTKNHLLCTSCNHQLILKFSDNYNDKSHMDYQYDIINEELLNNAQEDALNELLHDKYLTQIITEGHAKNCSWRNFETPLNGVYYPRPYINQTNEILIRDYLNILQNLINNSITLNEYVDNISNVIISSDSEDEQFKKFIKTSNQWIIARFFQNNKENIAVLLDFTPSWYYKLAMLGWSLNVQTFSNEVILLLICNKCNQRVFLNSTTNPHASPIKPHEDSLQLSNSKILTPCNYPITSSTTNQQSEFEFEYEYDVTAEFDKFDPYKEHKSWCCNIHNIVASDNSIHSKYYEYFIEMLNKSTSNIGPNGEYIVEPIEMNMNMNMSIDGLGNGNGNGNGDTLTSKRKTSFDINDGLERLNKLRKLYLIDE